MSSKEPILPVNSNSFKKDVNDLFSLSNEELSRLVEAYMSVNRSRSSFSLDHVANVVNAEPDRVKSIRSTFLYLVEMMKEHSPDTLADELVSLGCGNAKVELFKNRIKS